MYIDVVHVEEGVGGSDRRKERVSRSHTYTHIQTRGHIEGTHGYKERHRRGTHVREDDAHLTGHCPGKQWGAHGLIPVHVFFGRG